MSGLIQYDAIVVGARCAGSPVAMLLAWRGYRVLLVDRQTFPSDSMHGHYIKSPGIASLQRWGLLERVAATGCPPIEHITLDLGDFPLTLPIAGQDSVATTYGPRRIVLDQILLDAAIEAGAEFREGFAVHDLIFAGDRVVGIKGRAHGGAMVEERARIVIGADGQHSLVARKAGADVYDEQPARTFGYYTYFSDLPAAGIELTYRPTGLFLVFPTNDRLTVVAEQAPVAGFLAFREDIERSFSAMLEQLPTLAEQVHAARREERWLGTADLAGFFRKPFGPGWALVGDAGYHKDPITAWGISDAFRDAELLATAIDDGFSGRRPLEDALAGYETARNEDAKPKYDDTCWETTFAPFPPDVLAGRRVLAEEMRAST